MGGEETDIRRKNDRNVKSERRWVFDRRTKCSNGFVVVLVVVVVVCGKMDMDTCIKQKQLQLDPVPGFPHGNNRCEKPAEYRNNCQMSQCVELNRSSVQSLTENVVSESEQFLSLHGSRLRFSKRDSPFLVNIQKISQSARVFHFPESCVQPTPMAALITVYPTIDCR